MTVIALGWYYHSVQLRVESKHLLFNFELLSYMFRSYTRIILRFHIPKNV